MRDLGLSMHRHRASGIPRSARNDNTVVPRHTHGFHPLGRTLRKRKCAAGRR